MSVSPINIDNVAIERCHSESRAQLISTVYLNLQILYQKVHQGNTKGNVRIVPIAVNQSEDTSLALTEFSSVRYSSQGIRVVQVGTEQWGNTCRSEQASKSKVQSSSPYLDVVPCAIVSSVVRKGQTKG